MVHETTYHRIVEQLKNKNVTLIAVSKTKPVDDIQALFDLGQRDFGENYVQELVDKQPQLPEDIRWHFIGHLQTNKVKYIAPFVSLIHGVDSLKLLKEINKQAAKHNRVIDVLLQLHIAKEETKFGLDKEELEQIFQNGGSELSDLRNVVIKGFMGMASFTDNKEAIRKEFSYLKMLFDQYKGFTLPNCQLQTLSMGMSADYEIAIDEGSTMVRIGSLLFGERS